MRFRAYLKAQLTLRVLKPCVKGSRPFTVLGPTCRLRGFGKKVISGDISTLHDVILSVAIYPTCKFIAPLRGRLGHSSGCIGLNFNY